jgi:hypothetical protein
MEMAEEGNVVDPLLSADGSPDKLIYFFVLELNVL